MIGAGADEGAALAVMKAQRDVHALFDSEVFHRDQALIVVHRNHCIKFFEATRLHEDGVGRERAFCIDAERLRAE